MNVEKIELLFAKSFSLFIFSSLFANKRRENEPKEKKYRNRFQCPYGHIFKWIQQASLHSSLTIAASS